MEISFGMLSREYMLEECGQRRRSDGSSVLRLEGVMGWGVKFGGRQCATLDPQNATAAPIRHNTCHQ